MKTLRVIWPIIKSKFKTLNCPNSFLCSMVDFVLVCKLAVLIKANTLVIQLIRPINSIVFFLQRLQCLCTWLGGSDLGTSCPRFNVSGHWILRCLWCSLKILFSLSESLVLTPQVSGRYKQSPRRCS